LTGCYRESRAREWLFSRLRNSGALAGAALRAGVGELGEIVIVAGDLASPPHSQFDLAAGVYQDASDEALNRLLARWVRVGAGYLVVLNDLAKPDDDIVAQRASDTLLYQDRVYHWLSLGSADALDVADFIRGAASGFPTIAFIATRLTEPPWTSTELGDRGVLAFVKAIDIAITSAFDDEGYVTWSRTAHEVS
jgi:hypothetical protein